MGENIGGNCPGGCPNPMEDYMQQLRHPG